MRKKILIIEDNVEVCENLEEILSLANYQVSTAPNGKEGVEIAKVEKPDLIICDIMMPVMDGYGVLHLLSKNDETAKIPFIFLTAKAEKSDMRKGMEMGADDYLTKPFDDVELLSAVESRLRRVELLQKDFSNNLNGWQSFLGEINTYESMSTFSDNCEVRTYKKRAEIYTQGSYPRSVYLICNGKVKTSVSNTYGKEMITGLHAKGDFIGYVSLLKEEKHSNSAIALEDSEICEIPKEDFYELVYKHKEISRKFIQMLSNNVSEKEMQLVQLAHNSVRKRVADALINLKNHYQEDGKAFSINILREDLANIAGTANETVIRTLSDFKNEKLIDTKGSLITVLDEEKLKQMIN